MPKTKGIIAAGNPATADAAAIILEAGGNAFDAAVAACFASFVGEPAMSSIGGGGFMTAAPAGKKPVVYDFFCQTPRHKVPVEEMDFFPIEVNFGTDTETFHVGMASIAVPGCLAGIYKIHEQYCSLPITELVQPAIQFAKNGALIDSFQEYDIYLLTEILRLDPHMAEVIFPKGEAVKAGQFFVMPVFADFLESLAKEGSDLFYKGEVAQKFAKDNKERGGNITYEDLEQYKVIERDPMTVPYKGRKLFTNPLPSMGGSLIAIGLDRLSEINTGYAPGSLEHILALRPILAEIDKIHHTEGALHSTIWTLKDKYRGATTHFNILDEFGNGIAITTSNGACCGYSIPGTGIMLNNMLGEAALLPHGFHTWTRDARLPSMMSPSIVMDAANQVEIVCGSGGAGRIPGAILQVLHYLLDHGLAPKEAANAPRMHWRDGVLNVETGFPREIPGDAAMQQMIYWEKQSLFFGGVHHIAQQKGKYLAAGDDRRLGVVREVS